MAPQGAIWPMFYLQHIGAVVHFPNNITMCHFSNKIGVADVKLQTPSDLARLVKNARVQRDLTQQDVAGAVGITRQSLARLERGDGGTSFNTVLLILDYLDVRLDALAERRTSVPAAAATGSAAEAAAGALAKRIASRRFSGHLVVPGSVVVPPGATEVGPPANARGAE
ncbi:MAG: helix-turn-helix transcriptional regulator [Candidatus Microbacterium stercoravium]|uniref:Helix-turn-helix domain-containing protein n=1 Tax=Candidatus Microbacterium stercoravium TaxID=2838697 RepID=A0A9D2H6B2_9MICO|nr:helix-turn-helix domain-containing protein [Candidatus Microbacterium stercoravium]HJB62860.1 helix-turn-helix domain-containing protein [Candidatus Microbacterium pullistercoris]